MSLSALATVFVSYSYDSDEHRQWVLRLSQMLDTEPDIHVTFDQLDLYPGADVTHFMDHALTCDRIVIVSTPNYVLKASRREGGVGYETSIITAELARDQAQDKFIPLLRVGDQVPPFLQSKLRIDFREPRPFEEGVAELLSALRREAAAKRPPKRSRALGSDGGTSLPLIGIDPLEAVKPIQKQRAEPHRSSNYIHTPPPPPPKKIGLGQFGFRASGSSLTAIHITNIGDDVLRAVRVAVEFEQTRHFVIEFPDLAPRRREEISLIDAGARAGIDIGPLSRHLCDVFEGRVEPNWQNRMLLLYVDSTGREHAAAFLLGTRNKKPSLIRATVQRAH